MSDPRKEPKKQPDPLEVRLPGGVIFRRHPRPTDLLGPNDKPLIQPEHLRPKQKS